MSDLVVLALDIAKNRTGVAVGGPAWKRPIWCVHELAFDYEKQPGGALKAWRTFLINTMTQYCVTEVAVEMFFIDLKDFNFNGTLPMAQMHGVCLELCAERKVPCHQVPVQAWRKRFTGVGSVPKDMDDRANFKNRTAYWKQKAIEVCAAKGFYVTYHDEAEAIGILDFSLAALDAGYEFRTRPDTRRRELKADVAAFRGES